MFVKNSITSVRGSTLKTTRDSATPLVANMSAGGSSGGTGASLFVNSAYNYLFSGLIPATPDLADSTSLAYFYRDMYLHDNVGGSVVDIMSVFPFSEYELRGLEEKDLDIFETALDRLNLRDLFPQLSIAHLTDGYYCGSLVYDPEAKNFMDVLTHDALQCNVIPSPFNNIDPSVKVTTSGPTLQFLDNASSYAKKYVNSMPQGFIDLLKSGSFTLDPLTTLFVGRRGLTDRAYQSYLHRILPMYLIEKAMYRGTLTEAIRRQRAMTHITVGDDIWTPSGEEIRMHAQMFQDAERDPLGGWVGTRNAVQVNDLRPGGDFWKWTDMADTMVPSKLRALGVSEALLSGDACLVGATQIKQADGSCKSIETMCPVEGAVPSDLPVGEWFPCEGTVPNRVSESAQVAAWAHQGCRETFTVETAAGHVITGTDNHPFWVMDEATGECSWKRLDELKPGDLVGVED